ncbi:hypothetical protein BC937DRAFT_90007 [Endogone sp. FLAS-F59071]|nr:hypothetical protein BC937DRAFT_90007 [Endogone sp. FLAS-F59071]|eukprot:RUS17413.1 hypothetical protein BC937DRAFT_90007 [Endogone sp. FLAS-F59071]
MSCNTNTQLLDSPTLSSFSSLASEILAQIFGYFKPSSKGELPFKILNLSLVCKGWQAVAEFFLEQNMFEAPFAKMKYEDIRWFLHILQESAKLGVNYRHRVQYVDVNLDTCARETELKEVYFVICNLCSSARGTRIQGSYYHDDSLITSILKRTSTTELQIEKIPAYYIKRFLTKSRILRRLHNLTLSEEMKGMGNYRNDQFLRALGNKAQELRRLELRECISMMGDSFQRCYLKWPKLQYLLLPGCWNLSWEFVCAAVKACPNLREIHLPNRIMDGKGQCCEKAVKNLLEDHGFQPRDGTEWMIWYRDSIDSMG